MCSSDLLEAEGVNTKPAAIVDQVYDKLRPVVPQMVDRLIGLDFLNPDPAFSGGPPDFQQAINNRYATKAAALIQDGVPPATAHRSAVQETAAYALTQFTYVRWRGNIIPTSFSSISTCPA